MGGAPTLLLCQLVVGHHECHEFALLLNDERLHNCLQVVEFCLNLLGVDILTIVGENHSLAASANEAVARLIHNAHIASMEPALRVEHSLGCGGVFVVTEGYILASHANLTRDIVGVGRVNLHLHTRHQPTARERLVGGVVSVANQGSALGHTIAHSVGQLNLFEQLLNIAIERSTTHNKLGECATKGVHKLGAYFLIDEFVEQRNLGEGLHGLLLQGGHNLTLNDFLNQQGHREEQVGLHIFERFEQNRCCGQLTQQSDVRACCKGGEHIECATKSVCEGQDAQHSRATIVELVVNSENHIRGNIVHREHNALAKTGGTRGVGDDADLVVGHFGVADILHLEALGVALCKEALHILHQGCKRTLVTLPEGGHRLIVHHSLQLLELLNIEFIPNVGAEEEHTRVGVVYDIGSIDGVEVLQNGDNHCTIGDGCCIGSNPLGGVATNKSNFLACHNAILLECEVIFCHILSKFKICECGLFEIVTKGGELGIVAEALLVHLYKIFLYHSVCLSVCKRFVI